MGRIIILAVLLCALAAVGVIAAGGVVLDPEQQAEIDRKAAAPFVVPPEVDPVPPAPKLRPVSAPAQGRLGATVTMDQLHFGAKRTEVTAGESVRWVNRDRVAHELLSDDAIGAGAKPTFASKAIARGGSFRTTFENPGLVRYVCVLHPTSMVAYVVVKPR